jgi:hypothetical protein
VIRPSLALLTLTLGCGAAPAAPPTAHPPPPDDGASAPLPDDAQRFHALGFALLPTDDWRLLSDAERRDLPAQVAFVRDGGAALATVSLSPTTAETAEAALEGVEAATPRGLRQTERRRTRIFDRDAIRQVHEGAGRRSVEVAFVERGHLYRLQVTGDADPSLQGFFGLFRLLGGEGPIALPEAPPLADRLDVDGRAVDGRYESLAADLRIEAGNGFTLWVGESLRSTAPDAAFGLRRGHLALTVEARRFPEATRDRDAEARLAARGDALGPSVGGGRIAGFMGGALRYTRRRRGDFEYLLGARCGTERCLLVTAWYPAAESDVAIAELQQRRPIVRGLTEAERRACQAALRAPAVGGRRLGGGRVQRGRYLALEDDGIGLRLPDDGHWRLLEISQPSFGTEVRLEDRVRGVAAVLTSRPIDPMPSPRRLHGEARRRAGLQPGGPVRGLSLPGGVMALRSEGTVDGVGHRLVTAVAADRAVQLTVFGPPAFLEEPVVDGLVGALRLGPPPGPQRVGGRYEDLRFGFAVTLEGQGWRQADRTSRTARDRSTAVTFTRGDSALEVLALDLGPGGPGDLARAEAQVRRGFLERFEGLRDTGPETLDGAPARVLSSEEVTIRLLRVDRLLYAVLAVGGPDARFHLLP